MFSVKDAVVFCKVCTEKNILFILFSLENNV